VITDLHPLRAALSSALVALDFDGTLAPLSPHPDDARPLAGAQQILRDVRATGATLAVVTGRSVASLLRVTAFGAVPGIIIYGTHGAERWQAGELRTPAVPPGLDELRLSLPGLLTTLTSRTCGSRTRGYPWSYTRVQRTGRPALTVGVGHGPIAGQTDVTVPDPQGLITLLRGMLNGK